MPSTAAQDLVALRVHDRFHQAPGLVHLDRAGDGTHRQPGDAHREVAGLRLSLARPTRPSCGSEKTTSGTSRLAVLASPCSNRLVRTTRKSS